MKKIKLLKDHICPEGEFKAGEMIEVSEEHYDWLMSIYLTERKAQVAVEAEAKAILDKIGDHE